MGRHMRYDFTRPDGSRYAVPRISWPAAAGGAFSRGHGGPPARGAPRGGGPPHVSTQAAFDEVFYREGHPRQAGEHVMTRTRIRTFRSSRLAKAIPACSTRPWRAWAAYLEPLCLRPVAGVARWIGGDQ